LAAGSPALKKLSDDLGKLRLHPERLRQQFIFARHRPAFRSN
jgi:hypothetical protein